MLSFEDALEKLLAAARPVSEVRWLPTQAAAGRVLAEAQRSGLNVPPLDNSAMDGYAVRAADITAPETLLPVSQRIPAGSVGTTLQPGTAARIFTGAPIPEGADAVVMQERCEHGENGVLIKHQPQAGENIRRAGEDVAEGAEILAPGQRLRPQDIAFAASVGIAQLPVFRRLRVATFFTGDELKMPGEPLPPGAIYNSNRFAIVALLERLGCEVKDLGQVADTLDATRAALREAAAGSDLVITCGGVSVGEEDHVKPAVEAEGRLDMWQIAIKPGKPLAFGELSSGSNAAAFIGLPGNPVSAFVTFLMLVRPFILRCQGVADVAPRVYRLVAGSEWKKADKRREFLRASVNAAGEVLLYPHQGAGVMASVVHADGLIDNPPGQVIQPGEAVRFLPFAELLN
ncbi:MAG: molybdopterin molybdotransferase MoeA [Betaproteobacteria bacterium]|nr:molybdopterin molybdotransferase MoeA [Betaproteobacteria bacterium]